jgi:hypothetical protein
VVVELQEWLLVQERELASREDALMAREDELVAPECPLGRTQMECDVEHDRAKAVRQDYRARLRASTAGH